MNKDQTSETFLLEAIKFLELAADQYSRIPHVAIMRIKSIIEELEEIIEEVC
ncbi:MAG TPA: hypothetical protein VIM70_08270 [Clostridium sp.]|uniref:hypothetical protein n=1 Tax=Clostridium sp. TaxID=1506 RepID=UPI002F92EF21